MSILYDQLILAAHNLLNVWLDAYKIKRALKKNIPKSVRHGVNFAAYAITVGMVIWWRHMGVWDAVVFALSALFQRQLTFDIPLNWRRGLAWNYVSLDKPPNALMDKIEIRLFGYNGTAPVVVYGVCWAGLFITQYVI
jgi:hypothetical protein